MFISTRSTKEKKRKAISSMKEIACDAAYNSLKLPFDLAYSNSSKKLKNI